MAPASTAKLLTTSAALLAIDHDFRFRTKVVRGREPGSIVLVGGGDPTLSSLPRGQQSAYPGAARLDQLVREVKRATGGRITSISVDTSRYTGPEMGPGWSPGDVPNGYVAPIEPVMLDGGRSEPAAHVSPRSDTPALDAGRELTKRLGVPTESVSLGQAPDDGAPLAEVESQPLDRLIRTVLQHSDNVLAEALARQVALSTGHEPSFSGSVKAVREVLTENGLGHASFRIADGSGLSEENRITPAALVEVLRAASKPAESRSSDAAKLRPLLRALPVAGASGSLADRYDGAAALGRGWVRAKTGTLTDVNALAGTVVTKDGRLLAFAFLSGGTGSGSARPALDKLAAALHECGCG